MSAADCRIPENSQVSEAAAATGEPVDSGRAGSSRPGARLLLGMVRTYQQARSGRPTGCRYLPSCSEYAVEAISVHGSARGSWLTVRRIARCGPWGGHGIDPVPERSAPCAR